VPRREWPHPELGSAPGFSRALEAPAGRTIYIAGQVPTDASGATVGPGDMTAQAEVVFDKIAALVGAAGGTMNDVVKVNVFVTDMSRMDEVRRVRERHFTESPYPAMTGVEVRALAAPDWLLEVEAVAVIEA
jgi:enamine deaminase RidA (YjgF/YER057c/UK114 family)